MYLVWTKNLDTQEERDDFEREVLQSKRVVKRIYEIMEEREKLVDRTELSLNTYDKPNWDYRQAHNNGFRACLQYMKELLNLDQQMKETNDRPIQQ